MDGVLFIMLFSSAGIIAMLVFRGWELSRGKVVHRYPHIVMDGFVVVRKKLLQIKNVLLDVWFDFIALYLARVWVWTVKKVNWKSVATVVRGLYQSVRGIHADHGYPMPENSSDFLSHVSAHKKNTKRKKKVDTANSPMSNGEEKNE
jgi:hypothetical protein